MKNLQMLIVMLLLFQKLCAQQVGIGTLKPNTSAALHIESSDKGVIFPSVSLQNKFDGTTIQSPAATLFVFNKNSLFAEGKGFYYNAGTAASPDWTSVSELKIPFYRGTSADQTLFYIQNFGNGTALQASAFAGNALEVDGKIKIYGNGQTPAAGKVLTSDANGNASWQGGVAFAASRLVGGGSEKIAKNIHTKVPFLTIEYDLGGNYQNASGAPHSTFTAPVNGIYHFDAQITWSPSIGDQVESYANQLSLKRTRNGSTITLVSSQRFSNSEETCQLSIDCQLQQGDEINVWVVQRSYDFLDLRVSPIDDNFSYFSGRLVIRQ